jgi:hypothetical protein
MRAVLVDKLDVGSLMQKIRTVVSLLVFNDFYVDGEATMIMSYAHFGCELHEVKHIMEAFGNSAS